MRILALSLDLDDTLWPIAPVIERAERALDAFLHAHCPAVAEAFPVPAMRALRDRVAAEHPELAHDFSAQRRLSLAQAFAACGHADAALVDAAYDAYFEARNAVEPYPDALPALQRLAARLPLASVSNGNADLERIGLAHHFRARVSAREHGVGKPAPSIFRSACAALEVPPECVLHVGDDPLLDVAGARAAGLRCAWLNRDGRDWDHDGVVPDLTIPDLAALADWCERHVEGTMAA